MTESTGEIQKTGRFQPGQSGNPAGRPKGSRNKLSEAVICDILQDWEMHGMKAIEETRKNNPAQYLRVVAALIPKEFEATANYNVPFFEALVEINNREKNFLKDSVIDSFDENEKNYQVED